MSQHTINSLIAEQAGRIIDGDHHVILVLNQVDGQVKLRIILLIDKFVNGRCCKVFELFYE